MLAAAGGASARGGGGMRSNLVAARSASGGGVCTHIARAREPEVITRILAGEQVGTRLPPRPGAERPDGRRRWLGVARRVQGPHPRRRRRRPRPAQGRTRACCRPAPRSTAPFARGDTIGIIDPGGNEIARGLASMSSQELVTVRGRRMDAASAALGYALPSAAVHRDNLLLLAHHPW